MERIFNIAWAERRVPEDWQKAVVVLIWKKKGNNKNCETCRGISLMSHVGKMYAKILEQRARPKVEPHLSNAQCGFRKRQGCTDAIFALRQISEKTIEYDDEQNIIFVDQEKAFDRVDRNLLKKILEDYNVHRQLLDSIRALYEKCKSAVRTAHGLTNWFHVTTCVRQGCVLSPLLFITYINKITETANQDPFKLNELLFADDQVMMYENLQEHVNALNENCNPYNMKINTEKTDNENHLMYHML